MKKPILGVDCDLTLIDPVLEPYGWFYWLNASGRVSFDGERYKKDYIDNALDYDISSYFEMREGVDPLDFWRGNTIYDMMVPIIGAQEAIGVLSSRYDIICVTTIKGNHHKSKIRKLKQHFPEIKGFLCTKEKQYARVDIMVDDRADVLNRMPDDVKKIQIQTPFKQSEPLAHGKVFEGWEQITEELMK